MVRQENEWHWSLQKRGRSRDGSVEAAPGYEVPTKRGVARKGTISLRESCFDGKGSPGCLNLYGMAGEKIRV